MPAELFHRHKDNPLIAPADLPFHAASVFNAGCALVENETLLLLRVEGRNGLSSLYTARSANGVDGWRVDEAPCLAPQPDVHPFERWGLEDARITRLASLETWAVLYTGYSEHAPVVCLALTDDFRQFRRQGALLPPENKDAALFPVQFDGSWALLHRPVPRREGSGCNVWISYSPDLRHWGDHRPLLLSRKGAHWDAGKIGLCPPPLETEAGWLVCYHGVKRTSSGGIYRLGLALLDRDRPEEVIARGSEWIFAPQDPCERTGDVHNVTFSCGWSLVGDELRLYYGAADTSLCLATASLRQVLRWLQDQDVMG
jgi:predicted GH43/DUF377 family glycosyl hydrolase